jgi:hypothetical protein
VALAKRRTVVSLGIPALFVGVLALIALWRIGPPPGTLDEDRPAGRSEGENPITRIAELITQNAVGRQAAVNDAVIEHLVTTRTFWITDGSERAFVVLDPDVTRLDNVRVADGRHVRLVGLVRPAPNADRAMRQWGLDDDTAREVEMQGTYLHVTEIGVPVT